MDAKALITIVSIIIGFITFIDSKERNFFLLKFGKKDFILIGLIFIFINYLSFFQYPKKWGLFFDFFYSDNGLLPEHWAYLITLILLFYIWAKINLGFFPNGNKDALIKFYQGLLYKKDFNSLLTIVDKFHKKDIENYYKQLIPDSTLGMSNLGLLILESEKSRIQKWQEKLKTKKDSFTKKVLPSSKRNRSEFANNVMWELIGRDEFIENIAPLSPLFFTDIIKNLSGEKLRYIPNQFTNRVFSVLLRNKNYWLFKELKNTHIVINSRISYVLDDKTPILNSIIENLEIAKDNSIWKTFGDASTNEIWIEKFKKESSFFAEKNTDTGFEKESITHNVIHFFDILIRKGIEVNERDHMWLHYYHVIVSRMCFNIEKLYELDEDSYYHSNIKIIFLNLISWLELINNNKKDVLYIDIIRCWGNCIMEISEVTLLDGSYAFSKDFIQDRIEDLLTIYLNLKYYKFYFKILDEFDKVLLKPSTSIQKPHRYYEILDYSFQCLDHIKFQTYNGDDYLPLRRLRVKIINELEIIVNY